METLDVVPIRKRAERLDVFVQCVFNNRHKLLGLLEEIFGKEKELMTGTIEDDESYVLESNEGKYSRKQKIPP